MVINRITPPLFTGTLSSLYSENSIRNRIKMSDKHSTIEEDRTGSSAGDAAAAHAASDDDHLHDGAACCGNSTKRMRAASVPSDSRLLELSVPLATRSSHETPEEKRRRTERLADAVKELLGCLGEDPSREGLLDTPKRAAEAFMFWTKGYEENLVSRTSVLRVFITHDMTNPMFDFRWIL